MTNKEKLFDRRVVERNIAKGLITEEEYHAYLASLEDSEHKAEAFKAEFVEGVLDDDEDEDE